MPCYKPLQAWVCDAPNKSGKCSLTWDIKKTAHPERIVQVPCGKCIGCLLERSRQWAIRCVHEASVHEKNCFITLTYSDDNLPRDGNLDKKHFQDFMKAFRHLITRNVWDSVSRMYVPLPRKHWIRGKAGVRYFQCGEYGENGGRPHYHACLFGYDFPDKVLWSERDGVKLYRSAVLEEVWPYGYCTVGDVTFESAAYIARYCVKKLDKLKDNEKLMVMANPDLDERVVEYVTMSRRPGIGAGWFEKFYSDVYPSDMVVVRHGLICKPPKYYDSLYDDIDHDAMKSLKSARKEVAENNPNNGWQRLAVRHKVKLLKSRKLIRSYENG